MCRNFSSSSSGHLGLLASAGRADCSEYTDAESFVCRRPSPQRLCLKLRASVRMPQTTLIVLLFKRFRSSRRPIGEVCRVRLIVAGQSAKYALARPMSRDNRRSLQCALRRRGTIGVVYAGLLGTVGQTTKFVVRVASPWDNRRSLRRPGETDTSNYVE